MLPLTLNQALRGVKERKRTLPIDGVYSVLGLLPYNKQIKVDYSLSPKKALIEVMKTAAKNGYGEPLAWHGEGNNSWLPKVDEKGSVNIVGSLSIICQSQSVMFSTNDNLEINASRYKINSVIDNKINKIEGLLIEGGTHTKCVQIRTKHLNDRKEYITENITLLGTKETLEKVEVGNELLLFNENE